MIIAFLVVFCLLSLLVFVHELGHFLAAKRENVKVEEFGLGFPPRLFSKKLGETIYSINVIPFGGFVRLHGEELKAKDRRSFSSKSAWSRVKITTAGVFFNFLFALVVFLIVPFFGYVSVEPQDLTSYTNFKKLGIMVLDIEKSSPADKAGVLRSDIVVKVDSFEPLNTDDIIEYLKTKGNKIVQLTLKRKGKTVILELIPRVVLKENQGPTGMIVATVGVVSYQFPFGLYAGLKNFIKTTESIFVGFYNIATSLFSGKKTSVDIAGPVGIFSLGSSFFSFGFSSLLHFIGVLSINLAILNLIPFPALDGGRLLFLIIEVITRRKPKETYEIWFHKIGFILLLLLLAYFTFKDIQRFF